MGGDFRGTTEGPRSFAACPDRRKAALENAGTGLRSAAKLAPNSGAWDVDATRKPIRAARPAPLSAVLPDPGPGRAERQRVQEWRGAAGRLPAGVGSRDGGLLRQSGDGAVHSSVLPVLGLRRSACRKVREGAADPPDQGGRDLHHAAGRGRLLVQARAAAARRGVPDGPAVDTVRANQVRDPAAGAARKGADRRQRSGRDRHIARHPGRDDAGRVADGHGRQRTGAGFWSSGDDGTGRVRGQPRHSGSAGHRSVPALPMGAAGCHLAMPEIHGRQAHRDAFGAGHLLVLVLWRCVHRPAAAVHEVRARRRRIGIGAGPDPVLGRHRHRLPALRKALRSPRGDRSGAVRGHRHDAVRHRRLLRAFGRDHAGRHRLDRFPRRRWQLATADRFPADRGLRRLLHRAAVFPGAESFQPRRAESHHRRQQHLECPVHRAGGRLRRRHGQARLQRAGDLLRGRAAERAGGGDHLPAGAGIPDALPGVDAGERALPYSRRRAGPRPRTRPGADRVQPRELHRRADPGRHGAAPDPLRDVPQDFQDSGAVVHLPHRARHSDRARQGRRGADGAGLRRHRRRARRRRRGRNLSRGRDHPRRRDEPLPLRRGAHPGTTPGACGADRA